jgi:hypothetical protein
MREVFLVPACRSSGFTAACGISEFRQHTEKTHISFRLFAKLSDHANLFEEGDHNLQTDTLQPGEPEET